MSGLAGQDGGDRRDLDAERTVDAPTSRVEPVPRRARESAPLGVLAMVRETVVVVVVALALSLIVKTFLGQAFYIPSVSMADTLQVGDRVVVSKLTPGPFNLARGDVVVFVDPGGWLTPEVTRDVAPGRLRAILTFIGLLPNDSGNHLIKRVIGLPGDRVACCDAAGRITVNGTAIVEPYLRAGAAPSEKAFDVTVPAGNLWVMGDNRQESQDSRYKGFVPVRLVTGRAVAIVWPFSRADLLSRPEKTFAKVDRGSS